MADDEEVETENVGDKNVGDRRDVSQFLSDMRIDSAWDKMLEAN
jgi:hypothetical protein